MSEAAEGIRKGDVQVEGELAVQRGREVLRKRMDTQLCRPGSSKECGVVSRLRVASMARAQRVNVLGTL